MCPYAETCDFFNSRLKTMPAIAELFKLNYCRNNPDFCARKTLFMAFQNSKALLGIQEMEKIRSVLGEIYPNQAEVVKSVMDECRLKQP